MSADNELVSDSLYSKFAVFERAFDFCGFRTVRVAYQNLVIAGYIVDSLINEKVRCDF